MDVMMQDNKCKIENLVQILQYQTGAVTGTQRRSGPTQPIFVHALRAGLVPPFSAFFMEILRHYQIHLLHLHPASVTVLATFAYLCEAFIGVEPSVFFRHFYSLRLNATGVTGCVSFRLEPLVSASLITMAVTKRMEDFRHDWVFVDVGRADEALLELPAAKPEKIPVAWSSHRLDERAVMRPLLDRIALLRQAGLTGQMVAAE